MFLLPWNTFVTLFGNMSPPLLITRFFTEVGCKNSLAIELLKTVLQLSCFLSIFRAVGLCDHLCIPVVDSSRILKLAVHFHMLCKQMS